MNISIQYIITHYISFHFFSLMAQIQTQTQVLLQGPAGTRDFYPKEMAERLWLFDKWKTTSKAYGFSEYDAPVLEHANLYTRKGGDDILKEMYSFIDQGGIAVALRPEMTPSIARMIMAICKKEVLPLKWFSVPQCWRYETTTRGRKREHYQWNVDIFGAVEVRSEVEIIQMMVDFFKSVGLTDQDVVLRVSNRMILQKVLAGMGVHEDKMERSFNIIDKIKKVTAEDFYSMLKDEIGLEPESVDILVKVTQVSDVSQLASILSSEDDTVKEMLEIFALLEKCGYSSWVQLDLSIVRGLSYYTGLVFEGFSKNLTLQRSICGGGRYDNLLQHIGFDEKVPAVGFGFGDVVIMEVLAELGKVSYRYGC